MNIDEAWVRGSHHTIHQNIQQLEIDMDPPSVEEEKKAIKAIKMGNPGIDQVPMHSELLCYLAPAT